jgi:hypothetical protein
MLERCSEATQNSPPSRHEILPRGFFDEADVLAFLLQFKAKAEERYMETSIFGRSMHPKCSELSVLNQSVQLRARQVAGT